MSSILGYFCSVVYLLLVALLLDTHNVSSFIHSKGLQVVRNKVSLELAVDFTSIDATSVAVAAGVLFAGTKLAIYSKMQYVTGMSMSK